MKFDFDAEYFNPKDVLECGQVFRFAPHKDGYVVCSADKACYVHSDGIKTVVESDYPDYFYNYFDLGRDYAAIVELAKSYDIPVLTHCAEAAKGLRLLRQDPEETIFSFIISQNNNIKRITGIIDRLCESFGEKTDRGYMFPTLEKLVGVTAEDLAPLRAGFRARYIVDAVEKLHSTEVSLDGIKAMDTTAAREELKKIKGVGDKVADCVLLFGYHKTDAFPRDVWIKRIEQKLYPDGLPECIKGNEGIAQQFLFDYARTHEI